MFAPKKQLKIVFAKRTCKLTRVKTCDNSKQLACNPYDYTKLYRSTTETSVSTCAHNAKSQSHSAHLTTLLIHLSCKACACPSARAHDSMDSCKSAWDLSTNCIPCLYIANSTCLSTALLSCTSRPRRASPCTSRTPTLRSTAPFFTRRCPCQG